MSNAELIRNLQEAMQSRSRPAPYDATAVVTRVDGTTAWVRLAGSDTETPIKRTIDAKAGDVVQVRVNGGTAWITGNSTAPPTDDRTARQAVQTAEKAHVEATKAVEQTAENTRAIGQQAQSIQNNYRAITRIDTTAVTGVIVQYAKSDSPTDPPTRGWSDASPTWESGKYIWQRTVTTIDGEQIISNVSCIQGAKGEDGADGTSVTILGHYDTYAELTAAHPTGSSGDAYMVGADLYVWNGTAWENVGQIQGPQGDTGPKGDTGRGIASITPEYYLSTSNTTQTGGSWSATVPAYVEGRYYWTRSKIMWDDSDTPTYTTPVLDTAITNANSAAYQALRRAGNAEDVAYATKQYFWDDTNGVHISSEPDAPTATRNMLLNSLGMLFRRGANNLLALLTGTNPSVNIYDGRGNADSNVLAQFAASGVRIGKNGQTNVQIAPDNVVMTAPDGNTGMRVSYTSLNDDSGDLAYGIAIDDGDIYSGISLIPAKDDGEFNGRREYVARMDRYTWQSKNGQLWLTDDGLEMRSNDSEALPMTMGFDGVVEVSGGYGGLVAVETDTVSISYAAGTIGTRGAIALVGTTIKSGYTYIGASIVDHRNTVPFMAVISENMTTSNVHVCAYRATGNAVSNAEVTVRRVWLKTGTTA